MQEMTMVESVARAIYDAGRSYGSKPWSRAEKADRDDSLYLARAAIEAMRTPTSAMIDEGNAHDEWVPYDIYESMIDAALSE